MGAASEGVTVDLECLADRFADLQARHEFVVVEGAGGWSVPLAGPSPRWILQAELVRRLSLPAVLVTGLRLGCISHALLTAEAVAARGLRLAGWVANVVDARMRFQQENIDTLRERLPAPLLGVIPRLPVVSAAAAASHLDCSGLPDWPGAGAGTGEAAPSHPFSPEAKEV